MRDKARGDYRQVANAVDTTDEEEFARDILNSIEGMPAGRNVTKIYRSAAGYLSGE